MSSNLKSHRPEGSFEGELHSQVTVVITVPFVPVFPDVNRTQERGESAIRTFSNTLQQARLILPDGEIIVVLEKKIKNQMVLKKRDSKTRLRRPKKKGIKNRNKYPR